ncbi:MAG: aminoacyl-tRNA hydrolase [Rhodospirillales bacterium]
MLLVVGLGNPGSQYAHNRHNFGFMAADALVRRHGFSDYRMKFHGEIAEGTIGGTKVLVLKPMTYMNDSGRSVAAAVQFYKLAPEDVLVLHDELDLAPGKVRAKRSGGLAGHNGLRDIKAHIGPDFRRLRLGIGHPGNKALVQAYALRDFPKADAGWREKLLEAVAENFSLLVEGDDSGFMTKVAQATTPPKPKSPRGESEESDDTNGI